jgi:HAD superfamily phosphoserine phosphatase-like hydrolase
VRKVAIYDLDGTVLRRATFTPFLFFAARRHEPWRMLLAPAWFSAMGLYKLGLFDRRTLKQFGLRLFLGRRMTHSRLEAISEAFADHAAAMWPAPGAMRAMAADRAEGATLVLATAAMEFYAGGIARRLGFDHVLASRNVPLSTHPSACLIEGENCYGAEKPMRVTALFEELGWSRAECMVSFYTDSVSDAPLLDWADVAVLVNAGPRARRIAAAHGWATAKF